MLAGQMSLLLVGCKFSSLEVSILEAQIWLVKPTLDLKTKPIIIVFIKRMMLSLSGTLLLEAATCCIHCA
jgi:hypothetical protein